MTGARAFPAWQEADPFELPEWAGTGTVTWTATAAISAGHLITGELVGGSPDARLVCDLYAVDEAFPRPVADEELRRHTHQAWQRGEVFTIDCEGRLTLTAPGCGFDADRILDLVERFARAVGARPSDYGVRLIIGRDRARHDPPRDPLR